MARVNPVFVENDGLKNQNQLLLKQIQSLSRQLDDAQCRDWYFRENNYLFKFS